MEPLVGLTAQIAASAIITTTILFLLAVLYQATTLRQRGAPWRAFVAPFCTNIGMVLAVLAFPLHLPMLNFGAAALALGGRRFARDAVPILPSPVERVLGAMATATLLAVAVHFILPRL